MNKGDNMYWEYKTINYTIDNSVAVVELNRPC